MAGKRVYTREMVLDAAFGILRERGWREVTARTVAKDLASSTMPIYSLLGSMDEVKDVLRRKALELLKEYQSWAYTDQALMNLAVGYVVFARDEIRLFRFMFFEEPERMSGEETKTIIEGFDREFGKRSLIEEIFSELRGGEADGFVLKNWIFTHGIAVLHNSGVLSMDTDEIIRILGEAGGAFYLWEKEKKK